VICKCPLKISAPKGCSLEYVLCSNVEDCKLARDYTSKVINLKKIKIVKNLKAIAKFSKDVKIATYISNTLRDLVELDKLEAK